MCFGIQSLSSPPTGIELAGSLDMGSERVKRHELARG